MADTIEMSPGSAPKTAAHDSTASATDATAAQRRERRARIVGAHERLADQERADAVRAQRGDVGRCEDAAFGDDEPVRRDARQEIERRC
jgi:hypothetical protein